MEVAIHENKSNYTATEAVLLKQAYDALEVKAQNGELSIEETRIRVAYLRYMREDNFKIVVEKKKTVKEPKAPKEPKTRTRKTKQEIPKIPDKSDDIKKAQQLWAMKQLGKELTEEEDAFVTKLLPPPPEL